MDTHEIALHLEIATLLERPRTRQRPPTLVHRYFTELGLFCLLEAKVSEIISFRYGVNY
jgi:hypothetical protein